MERLVKLNLQEAFYAPNLWSARYKAKNLLLIPYSLADFLRFGTVGRVGLRQLRPHLLPPGTQARAELGGALGLCGGQVVLFTGVVAEAVEFDVVILEILQQFPVAAADRTDRGSSGVIVGVVEQERVAGEALLGAVNAVQFPLVRERLPTVVLQVQVQAVLVTRSGENESPTCSPTPRSVRVVSPYIGQWWPKTSVCF